MTVGYRNSAGVDFDSLYDPYVTGTKPGNTGFRDSSGVDLQHRYAPVSFGSAGANVGFRTSGGADVSTLWAAIGTAIYVQANTGLPGSITDYQVAPSGPVTSTVTFHHNRDGTTDWSSGSDTWIVPTGSTVGDAYDVRYTQTASNGSGSVTGTALNTWTQLNAQRGLTLSVTRSSVGAITATRTIQVEIRRRSDNAVMATFSVNLQAQAEIS